MVIYLTLSCSYCLQPVLFVDEMPARNAWLSSSSWPTMISLAINSADSINATWYERDLSCSSWGLDDDIDAWCGRFKVVKGSNVLAPFAILNVNGDGIIIDGKDLVVADERWFSPQHLGTGASPCCFGTNKSISEGDSVLGNIVVVVVAAAVAKEELPVPLLLLLRSFMIIKTKWLKPNGSRYAIMSFGSDMFKKIEREEECYIFFWSCFSKPFRKTNL